MPLDEPSMAHHRDSWPPTILRLEGVDLADLADLEDIDSNPFAFFLTTPEIIDDDDVEDLSAGIESDEDMLPEIRDVSPSSLQRDISDPEDDSSTPQDTHRATGPALSLKDFTDAHPSDGGRRTSRKETHMEAHKSPYIVRGRAIFREHRRGRGRTRSLSSQSSHSWREPSADVWSIPEEDEDVEETVIVADWEKYQGSLEGKLDDNTDLLLPQKKPKKKVRWALP